MEVLKQIQSFLQDFNIITIAIRLILAALFGGVIGIERGRQRRAAGLRTHILVCLGAALAATVGFFSCEVLGNEHADPLRVSAQVISGIGFLGVGTILVKGRFQITGLTTAAGLWVTAAIGIALGAGFYEGAIVAFAVSVLTVVVLHRLERRVNKHHSSFGIYVEIRGDQNIRACLDYLAENFNAHDLQVTSPRSGMAGNVGIESSISPVYGRKTNRRVKTEEAEAQAHYAKLSIPLVTSELEKLDYVVYSLESV